MTDRAKIERLLNMTGRTLEGLPEDYGDEKLKAWRSFRDGKFGHVKSFEMANQILHQSDVIELLVGALRDALEKPRVMSFGELRKAGNLVPCWIEEKYVMYPDLLQDSNGTYYGRMQLRDGILPKSYYLLEKDQYGKTWRCWTRRPTDEEREAAKWEN